MPPFVRAVELDTPRPTTRTWPAVADDPNSALAQIDADVWEPFARSYATLDADLFGSILHPEHVRVGEADVTDARGYVAETRRGFERAQQTRDTLAIRFRFDRRVTGDGCAFEVGSFDVTITSIAGAVQRFAGRFRAVSRHTPAGWRLLVDEDGGAIDATPPP